MRKYKKLWENKKWSEFSEKVKRRDNYSCLQCGRNKDDIVLQVHHEVYIRNKLPWEYSLSDCRSLCKGWSLLSVNDLGDLIGICERKDCGNSIRYENHTYHPDWGYKIVGSTCIQHLTQEDKLLSNNLINSYKLISKFIHTSIWEKGLTKNKKKYIYTSHKHHVIRIYGRDDFYSFQILLKVKGKKWHDLQKLISTRKKGLEEVKELAYIVLKGTISSSEKEKLLLREMYQNIKNT